MERQGAAPRQSRTEMSEPSKEQITQLLLRWNAGNKQALDALMPLVANELRRLAGSYLRNENQGHTLQPTALVNECYLRLIDRRKVDWQSRAHFFAFAARTMRRILVDHARARASAKRGSGIPPLSLETVVRLPAKEDVDLLALDDALTDLANLDHRQSQMVELRFFGGLSIPEIAAVLDVAETTVSRDWVSAKAWLSRELKRN